MRGVRKAFAGRACLLPLVQFSWVDGIYAVDRRRTNRVKMHHNLPYVASGRAPAWRRAASGDRGASGVGGRPAGSAGFPMCLRVVCQRTFVPSQGGAVKGDRVEIVVDTGDGAKTYEVRCHPGRPAGRGQHRAGRGGGDRGHQDGHGGAHRPLHGQPDHRPRRAPGRHLGSGLMRRSAEDRGDGSRRPVLH